MQHAAGPPFLPRMSCTRSPTPCAADPLAHSSPPNRCTLEECSSPVSTSQTGSSGQFFGRVVERDQDCLALGDFESEDADVFGERAAELRGVLLRDVAWLRQEGLA